MEKSCTNCGAVVCDHKDSMRCASGYSLWKPMPFKREARYHVIKLKTGKPVDCVVVESDWPIYEDVWSMIQCVYEQKPTELEQLRQRVKELESSPTMAACKEMIRDAAVKEASVLFEKLAASQQRVAELESKWLSPETYKMLMQERSETLKELAASQLQNSRLRKFVEELWQIIDDIDTYGDMAKSDNKLFRSLVERRQKDRWKTGIDCDGHTLKHEALSEPTDTEALEKYVMERLGEPVAFCTYKGYLLHAGDPKVQEHSEPEPLYSMKEPK